MRVVHGIVAVSLVLSATEAFARDLKVPQRFRSIEAASKKARPGDRILVRGRLRKAQRFTASDVSLDLWRARLDRSLTIEADRSEVAGGDVRGTLFVRGFSVTVSSTRVGGAWKGTTTKSSDRRASVRVEGENATLSGMSIAASEGAAAISVTGYAFHLQSNDVRSGDVELLGERGVVLGNILRDGCIACEGLYAQVMSNEVHADGVDAITMSSEQAYVSHNDVVVTDGAAIVSSGQWTYVGSNTVSIDSAGADGRAAIFVDGAGSSVSDNEVTRSETSDVDGIAAAGASIHVENNLVVGADGSNRGIFVDGIGNLVRDNVVIGGGDGIFVCGDFNDVWENEVRDVRGDGIVVAGEKPTVRDADVQGAAGSGVVLFDPTELSGGSVVGNGMGGIVIFDDGCTLTDCGLSGNGLADVITAGGVSTSGLSPGAVIVNDPLQFPELLERWPTAPTVVISPEDWNFYFFD